MEVDSKFPFSNIWRLPPKELQLTGGVVNVYRISLDLPEADILQMSQLLSPDEIARANRFVFPNYRAHFIAGRAQMRMILSRYLDHSPADLIFDYNEYGKPALSFPVSDLQFNISHSHELGLVAVAREKLIGVDIERMRSDIDYTQIAQQFFAPGEVEKLFDLPLELQLEAFYACWTRKEAFIKARGMGLTIPLDQFEVSFTPSLPARLLYSGSNPVAEREWSIFELKPGTGYTAALAVQDINWEVQCWQWHLGRT
jgi:4'-phosphopantetheinyl transferase